MVSLSSIYISGSSKIHTVPDEIIVSPHGLIVNAVIVTDSPGSIKPSAIGLRVKIIVSCPGKKVTGLVKAAKSVPSCPVPLRE